MDLDADKAHQKHNVYHKRCEFSKVNKVSCLGSFLAFFGRNRSQQSSRVERLSLRLFVAEWWLSCTKRKMFVWSLSKSWDLGKITRGSEQIWVETLTSRGFLFANEYFLRHDKIFLSKLFLPREEVFKLLKTLPLGSRFFVIIWFA